MYVGIILVTLIVFIAIVAILLLNNGVSKTFQNKITAGLHHWSQADEELAKMSKDWLEAMRKEVDKVLEYPEDLYDDTYLKLSNLSERLYRTLYPGGLKS